MGRERGRGRGWRPVDEHRLGAWTRMEVETHRRSQDGNGDGSGDVSGDGNGAGTGTGLSVETRRRTQDGSGDWNGGCCLLFVVFLTLTDPLRIQPWLKDRRNHTKSNRETEISRESRQKRTDKKVASKGHRRDKI